MFSMFRAITSRTLCSIRDFWNFHWVLPSSTLEAKWYCLRAFYQGHVLFPKVVNVLLALLEPVGGFAVGALGAWRGFV